MFGTIQCHVFLISLYFPPFILLAVVKLQIRILPRFHPIDDDCRSYCNVFFVTSFIMGVIHEGR